MIIDTEKCFVVGDTHAEWRRLNILINKKQPTSIIQVGDFGYWPKFDNSTVLGDTIIKHDKVVRKKWFLNGIKNPKTPIFWCDGNHEDHESLNNLTNQHGYTNPIEVLPNVFYMPRASIIKTTKGFTILFIGGANSIDAAWRTPGHDWFHNETISLGDVERLPNTQIDIVISHTCPHEFTLKKDFYDGAKFKDPSMDALSLVLDKYKPKKWYFGHFHMHDQGIYNNTRWCCLNMASDSGWYCKL